MQKLKLFLLLVFFIWFYYLIPATLFHNPHCTVLIDRNNELLGAHIAIDGQWRFPSSTEIPAKFTDALLTYEDKRFFSHFGIDFLAFARAVKLNFQKKKIVSGGSTISMQVVRLFLQENNRSFLEKLKEIILAFRLECSYSKKEILSLYAANAPFGGNVVGLDAAAWRYFGRKPENLSWAEVATLAILPNSPSLIHFGKNREKLLQKRNKLLRRLYEAKKIDKVTYQLSLDEAIPSKPVKFPEIAPHILQAKANENNDGSLVKTSLQLNLQNAVNEIIKRHNELLAGNQIHNAGAIVIRVETGEILAYAGNVHSPDIKDHNNDVDVVNAPRSTGSILKPLLYASMLSSGDILPNTLVPDIPIQIGGYSPQNYSKGYDGAIPAHKALARSLNVPAVKMLQHFGIEKFHQILKKIGMTTINQPSDYYGLSLILGGCEGKLNEIAGIYASMARTLNHYNKYGKYNRNDYFPPYFEQNIIQEKTYNENNSYFDAASIWFTFNAMIDVERPDDESNWREFSSSRKVAWKTGTSFGFRDAWAVGVTPEYVVGVWVGNATGEGRPNLVGVKTAAPILFDIFNQLPGANKWFEKPETEMVDAKICRESGYLCSDICPNPQIRKIPKNGLRFDVCPFHKLIHLDATGKFRVTSDCERIENMKHISWFVLPPSMEYYYKLRNPMYQELPPYRADCEQTAMTSSGKMMEMIYPSSYSKIYVPIELDGKLGKTIFEIAHRRKEAKIFWHIDDKYLGQTYDLHQFALSPSAGNHILTAIDDKGEKLIVKFEIIGKKRQTEQN